MRRSIIALIIPALAFLLIPASRTLAADKYAIDPVHCHIGFSVKHLVINNIRGRFNDYTGAIVYDEQDITKSSVEITIKAASINSDFKFRDDHLRAPDFF